MMADPGVLGFIALSVVSFAALLLVLRIISRVVRLKLPSASQKNLQALRVPLYLLSLALALRAWVWWLPWSELYLNQPLWDSISGTLLAIVFVWLAVRSITLSLFVLYLHQIQGIAVPRALVWITNKLLYISAILVYLHLEYSFAIGDLILTTAVVFTVLSIAFQRPLGAFISDLVASMGNTFKEGDLLRVGAFEGVVVENEWNRIQLLSHEGLEITVPIRELGELPVVKLKSPGRVYRGRCRVQLNGSLSPLLVCQALVRTALDTGHTLAHPPPLAYQVGNGAPGCIEYLLEYSLADYFQEAQVNSEINTHLWYKLRRQGVAFPFGRGGEPDAPRESMDATAVAQFLGSMEIFSALSPQELLTLAGLAHYGVYGPGECLFRQGEPGDSLYAVCRGCIDIRLQHPDESAEASVAQLGAGSIIGEISLLTGELRSASAVVLSESELVRVDKFGFQQILARNPAIAETLTDVMLERQRRNAESIKTSDSGQNASQRHDLLSRIKLFFQI